MPLPDDANFDDAVKSVRQQETRGTSDETLSLWEDIYRRFPDEPLARRFLVRALERAGRRNDAIELLEDLPILAITPTELQRAAECMSEMRDADTAADLFFALLERNPDCARVRAIFAKYMYQKGDLLTAFELLDPIPPADLSPATEKILFDTDRAIEAMEAITPGSTAELPRPATVMRNAIRLFEDRAISTSAAGIGRVAFYTGSLGAGGAERQMTRIATALKARAGMKAGDDPAPSGPFEIIVNSIDPDSNKDFFRPTLDAANLPLHVVRDMPQTDSRTLQTGHVLLDDLAPLLPSHVRFGMERLFSHLKLSKPEVLYIWQDGAVLTGALAAVAAGVPRIVISLRGLPPNLRPHMMKPEYHDLFTALAAVPGVSFSCNSVVAAEAYAAWLDLPRSAFETIYNACETLSTAAPDKETSLWDAFEAATADATHTIGGLFRFNANKRPGLWLDTAKAVLAARSATRFVLVGDGEDREAAEAHAETLGIADRVLFVGRSEAVGYWLDRLDILLHVPVNEGLPNALIEAQASGVPVVATPAGGSAETFVDARTGILLKSADAIEVTEVARAILDLLESPARLRRMGRAAKKQAAAKFDIEKVLAKTIAFMQATSLHASENVAAPADAGNPGNRLEPAA